MAYKSKLYQLIVYSSSSVVSVESGSNSVRDSDVDSGNCCSESTDPISDSLPNLYSKLNVFLSKS